MIVLGGVMALAAFVGWRLLRRRQERRANLWLAKRAVGHKRPDLR